VMFIDAPDPSQTAVSVTANHLTLLIPLTVLTIVLGIYFYPLAHYTNQSLRFFIK
jgi:hypothetical protein